LPIITKLVNGGFKMPTLAGLTSMWVQSLGRAMESFNEVDNYRHYQEMEMT
jgi:hypothetical protein